MGLRGGLGRVVWNLGGSGHGAAPLEGFGGVGLSRGVPGVAVGLRGFAVGEGCGGSACW